MNRMRSPHTALAALVLTFGVGCTSLEAAGSDQDTGAGGRVADEDASAGDGAMAVDPPLAGHAAGAADDAGGTGAPADAATEPPLGGEVCRSLAPCQGDFLGTWTIQAFCPRAALRRTAVAIRLGLAAECVRITGVDADVDGQLTASAGLPEDTSYPVTIDAVYSLEVDAELDLACIHDAANGTASDPQERCAQISATGAASEGEATEWTCTAGGDVCRCRLHWPARAWSGDARATGDAFYEGRYCVRDDSLRVVADLEGREVLMLLEQRTL